jgi:hypothetical protein
VVKEIAHVGFPHLRRLLLSFNEIESIELLPRIDMPNVWDISLRKIGHKTRIQPNQNNSDPSKSTLAFFFRSTNLFLIPYSD